MNNQSMLSRAADSIYWISRYVERAESVARFIDVNLNMTLDLPADIGEQWLPLVNVSGDIHPFKERYDEPSKENVIHFLTFDLANPNSIISCLRAARQNARTVREIFSSELWEQLNKLYLMVNAASGNGAMDSLYQPGDMTYAEVVDFDEVRTGCRLFEGVAESTMLHDEAWHFMRLGRMIERADKTSRILDVKYFILLPSVSDVGGPIDEIQWAAVLKSVSGFEMYRKRHGPISPTDTVDFLLLNRDFPRAIHFCVLAAAESLHAITASPIGTFSNLAEKRLGLLEAELNYTQISEVIAGGLHEFLDGFQQKLNLVGDAIFETFFALRPVDSGTVLQS